MKKQLAIALTAALLTFPAAPGLVMADTPTDSGTTAVTNTTTQTDSTGSSSSTSASTNTGTSTTVPTATTSTSTTTTSSAITAPVVDQNGQTVNPGVLPDSPWYWFQTLMEKVQLALTFDPVKKADLVEKQATEDLAEAQALIKKGNTAEAEKALTRYNEKIDRAQAFLEQLKDPNSETAKKVQLALTKVNTNNMVVLGSLLEKLPPQAAQRLALNIVRSVEKAVAKAEKMDKKKGEDSAAGTTTSTTQSTATVSADQSGTTDQVQLSQEAKQALEEFQVALGVKHTPNGYAYGHYKNKDKEEKDGEDQDDQEDQEKTTNSNSSTTSGQTTQQPQVQQQTQKQAQTQQQTQQQYQKHQSQLNQSGNNSDEKNHEEQERNENGDKSDKEKGHR